MLFIGIGNVGMFSSLGFTFDFLGHTYNVDDVFLSENEVGPWHRRQHSAFLLRLRTNGVACIH